MLHSACRELPQVGEPKWLAHQGYPTIKVSDPPLRVTLPATPETTLVFSCKQFAAIHKEMYKKFSRLRCFGKEGNLPARDSFSPCKKALCAPLIIPPPPPRVYFNCVLYRRTVSKISTAIKKTKGGS